MIALVEGASRQKTPNEIALTILLSGLTIIFLLAVRHAAAVRDLQRRRRCRVPVLVALLVCLIPTTIGGLLSAIGIAGMDRMIQHNVIAMSGRAVEAAGDVNTLLLDKTGTITLGNRQAVEFLPVAGVRVEELADRAQLASLADETPEGRSIVVLAKETLRTSRPPGGAGDRAVRDDVRSVLRAHPDERGERRRPPASQGRGRCDRRAGSRERAAPCRRSSTRIVESHRPRRRHAAGRGASENGGPRVLGVIPPQGCGEGRASRSGSSDFAPWGSAR